MKNYYKILQVDEDASDEIIKVAHKSLVKKYHPDLNKGKDRKVYEKRIKEINEAYEILSDPILKMEYDRKLFENETISTEQNQYSQYDNDINNAQYNNNIPYREAKNESFIKTIWNSVDKDMKSAFLILFVLFIIYLILKIPFLKGLLGNIFSNCFPVLIVLLVGVIYLFFFRNKK